ncbi:MAG: rhodanese-like domain-containing protein [Bacteroidales bacterium]|nr:rhodanese-like domain-containing protein [Bacteroidales bacterium]
MQKQTSVEEFFKRAESLPIIDVRSPGEFEHAHIPGALSLPLFSDIEKAV